MAKNKTVFDTNIWISYFLQSRFTDIIEMIENNSVEFFRDIQSKQELKEVLSRSKFKKYLILPISEYISFYDEISTYIKTSKHFNLCVDSKDNFLFDLAIQSKSKYLVSGDKHVLQTIVTQPPYVVNLTTFKQHISIK